MYYNVLINYVTSVAVQRAMYCTLLRIFATCIIIYIVYKGVIAFLRLVVCNYRQDVEHCHCYFIVECSRSDLQVRKNFFSKILSIAQINNRFLFAPYGVLRKIGVRGPRPRPFWGNAREFVEVSVL